MFTVNRKGEKVGLPSEVLLTKEGVRGKGPSASPSFSTLPTGSRNPRFMESLLPLCACTGTMNDRLVRSGLSFSLSSPGGEGWGEEAVPFSCPGSVQGGQGDGSATTSAHKYCRPLKE